MAEQHCRQAVHHRLGRTAGGPHQRVQREQPYFDVDHFERPKFVSGRSERCAIRRGHQRGDRAYGQRHGHLGQRNPHRRDERRARYAERESLRDRLRRTHEQRGQQQRAALGRGVRHEPVCVLLHRVELQSQPATPHDRATGECAADARAAAADLFARIGGWDLHDNQVVAGNTATGAHANLFRDVSQAVTAFYSALASVGADNQVTTFTASDFGRTYNTNGDGSDHGWGSHHFVVGGAVNGGEIYGRMPAFDINGPDDTGRGRWIPSTSVDEYSATLAKWFGVSGTNLPVVLPNIGRFAKPDLGFMAA